MKRLTTIIGLLLVAFTISAQDFMINTANRQSVSLNGKWRYIIDPYETGFYSYRYEPYDEAEDISTTGGFFNDAVAKDKTDRVEYSFEKSPSLMVPGDWNSQEEELNYYEGTIWYKKSFDYTPSGDGNRAFIYFGAINYRADVYLNSHKLGMHEGGFTPFQFEVTDIIREKDNYLIVRVDNKRAKEFVPTLNTDWWNYGGITRTVKLIETPATFIKDYKLAITGENFIQGYVQLDGKEIQGQDIAVTIPGTGMEISTTTGENGKAEFNQKAKKIKLWTPEEPKLYNVEIKAGNDKVSEKMGFRTIQTRGTDILLNGEPVYLRGICLHEENPFTAGRAYSLEDARMLLGWAKEMNCNFVRLAHYPHNENMARVADEMGIMLWEEIPVYWTIQWENTETYENAENQLKELVRRDKNRASVIIWSVGNETPVQDARTTFMTKLAKKAKELDDTRLISAAMEVNWEKFDDKILVIDDPLGEHVDILSYNEYIGWYVGTPALCDSVAWEYHYEKPVLISETGGGALGGYHADSLTRWSEEYQEWLYKEQVKMLDKVDQVKGMTPWILVDFRSPKRLLPNIQDGWNLKGVVSRNGDKKKAFYILQDYYETKK